MKVCEVIISKHQTFKMVIAKKAVEEKLIGTIVKEIFVPGKLINIVIR